MSSTSLLYVTHTSLQSEESQKDSFHAVWNGMNRHGRRHLILNLQLLVEDEGNQDAREQTLSTMGTFLRHFNASTEHDTYVSNFVTELTGLSAQATREMLSLAEAQRPTEIVFQEGNVRDVSLLTPASHDASSGSTMAVASDNTTFFTALDTTPSDTTTFFTALDTTASDATTYFTAMDPTVSGTTTTAPSTAESNSDHENSGASS